MQTVSEREHENNLRILKLIREDPGWALNRILLAENLEAALSAAEEQLGLERDARLLLANDLLTAEEREKTLREALERIANTNDSLDGHGIGGEADFAAEVLGTASGEGT